jgi:hypothetical protein
MGKVLIFRRKKPKAEFLREMILFAIGFAVVMTTIEQNLKPYCPGYYKTSQTKGEDCGRGESRRKDCFYKG